MRTQIFIALLLLTCVMVNAAEGVAPSSIQQQGYEQYCAEQVRITEENMVKFGEETNQQFEKQKAAVLEDIDKELRLFKFAGAIIVFISMLAALLLHDIIKKRMLRAESALKLKFAESAKNRGVE